MGGGETTICGFDGFVPRSGAGFTFGFLDRSQSPFAYQRISLHSPAILHFNLVVHPALSRARLTERTVNGRVARAIISAAGRLDLRTSDTETQKNY
jgi:hypothetical protein